MTLKSFVLTIRIGFNFLTFQPAFVSLRTGRPSNLSTLQPKAYLHFNVPIFQCSNFPILQPAFVSLRTGRPSNLSGRWPIRCKLFTFFTRAVHFQTIPSKFTRFYCVFSHNGSGLVFVNRGRTTTLNKIPCSLTISRLPFAV